MIKDHNIIIDYTVQVEKSMESLIHSFNSEIRKLEQNIETSKRVIDQENKK